MAAFGEEKRCKLIKCSLAGTLESLLVAAPELLRANLEKKNEALARAVVVVRDVMP